MKSESRFKKNLRRITAGSVVSQAIVLGATPFLSRLYGPEEFGVLAIFTASYAVLASLFTWKYELSIILPKEEETARQLTILTLLLSVAASFLLSLVLAVGQIGWGFLAHEIYVLLPLGVLVGTAYACAQQWSARENDYRRYAKSQIANVLVSVGVSASIALVTNGFVGGLVVGFVVGMIVALGYLAFGAMKLSIRSWMRALRLKSLHSVAYEYRRFPIYVLPSTLLLAIGVNSQPFIFQAIFTIKDVGLFAVANRFLMAPSSLIGGAVAEAFRAEFVARQREGHETSKFFLENLRRLVFIGIPVYSCFFLWAPDLFASLLGESYRDSGVLSRYLCVGVLAQFVAQPFHYVFVATGHARAGLVAQTGLTVMPVITLIGVGVAVGMLQAVLAAAVITAAMSAVMVWMAYRYCIANDVKGAEIRLNAREESGSQL